MFIAENDTNGAGYCKMGSGFVKMVVKWNSENFDMKTRVAMPKHAWKYPIFNSASICIFKLLKTRPEDPEFF